MRLLACFLTLVISALATFQFHYPVIRLKECPKISPQSMFDPEAYTGLWYEIRRLPSPVESGTCARVELTLKQDGNFDALFTDVGTGGGLHKITAKSFAPDPNQPALLRMKFGKYSSDIIEYRIMETDYSQYSLVTSCDKLSKVHVERAWIYSRNKTLPQSTIDVLESKLKNATFHTARLLDMEQVNCGL